MITEIPPAALRAYALFYGKYRTAPFQQSALDWVVGTAMRKKIFATLLRAGWIQKSTRMRYTCRKPDTVIGGLLEFRVPTAIRQAERPYAFTGLSSIELWSDYCYIQRSRERSPYFMKIVRKDLPYWKRFFNERSIPYYMQRGSTIGEFVILIPVDHVVAEEKAGMQVEPLQHTMRMAKDNEMYAYAYHYMREKYGTAAA